MEKINKHNLPFLMAGILGLLSALIGGLMRAGWQFPIVSIDLSLLHGPIMIGGFLGTVISLERAVALNKRWAYLAPLCTALGIVALWVTPLSFLAPWLILTGSLILIIIFVQFQKMKNSFDIFLMNVAAFVWAISNILWITGWPFNILTPWWIVFLLLTISAERIQLSGLGQKSFISTIGFNVALFFVLTALIFSFIAVAITWYFLATASIIFAIWLLIYDVPRYTIRRKELTKFIAANLLGGYFWLLISGILIFIELPLAGGLSYDAVLHSFFIGFVFSMIFGHAPIIFPAIIGSPINYHPRFYLHFGLLHFSLLFRIIMDMLDWLDGRYWASLLNVIAILLFLINTVSSILGNFSKSRSAALK
ncbi:MAG: hypothetical protein D8M58_19135 [Calditrichaeota bacterium]|nr:MAG: hypothetical protein DWQ03_21815 [Calditrichota bacterium]MBL1207526.1 hypothetical protein [Calditrichota bacterium]NOG47358.1 hypothetical protein [Calditrichota bacterium]